MKRVYVAGLYARNDDGSLADLIGVLQNIRTGQAASLKVLRAGMAPYCPWLDYQFSLLDDVPIPKKAYQANSMAWLEVSDAVWVISGECTGHGVDREIACAEELDIPVYRSFEELTAALLVDM